MNNILKPFVAAAMFCAVASSSFAQEAKPTAKEAVALVGKAVAYIKANGRTKAFAEFNNLNGQFIDRSLYIFVYDMKGNNLAIGNSSSARMIGKNLFDLRDPDGVYTIREVIDIGNTKGKGWVNHRFVNPVTKNIESKATYIEKYEDIIVGSGIFK
ncbi:MAG: cache domain-containing protein [Burkholderiaceae bacterium]